MEIDAVGGRHGDAAVGSRRDCYCRRRATRSWRIALRTMSEDASLEGLSLIARRILDLHLPPLVEGMHLSGDIQTPALHRAMWCSLVLFLAGSVLQAQPVVKGATFDAASVKLFNPDEQKVYSISGGPGSSDPGRLHMRVNMSILLGEAFGVAVDQIKGPAWTRDFSAMPFYDIVATMPADSSQTQKRQMLQNLLAERFHLVFHHETGNFPGYDLVVDQGGPKLKEATADPDPKPDPQAGKIGSDGFPVVSGRRTFSSRNGSVNQRVKDQEWTMADLARQLAFLIGRSMGQLVDDGFFQPRVTDKTGLTGKYTFILEYACPACARFASAVSVAADGSTSRPVEESLGYPNIFNAVQKQLGLRLVKTADVPMDVFVIDAVDKVPANN